MTVPCSIRMWHRSMHPVYFIHSALPGALLFRTIILLMEIILTPFLLIAGALVGCFLIYGFMAVFMGIISAPFFAADVIINAAKRHSDTP